MKIVTLGDSLMQYNGADTFPQEGWPQELPNYLKEGIPVHHYAKNGASTKSIETLGFYERALADTEEGDVVLLCFGHNDEKKEDPARYCPAFGSYKENLVRFASSFQKKGATVVMFTSIERLKFDEQGKLKKTHGDYIEAMKEAASEAKTPLIDLNALTRAEWQKLGYEGAKRYFMIFEEGEYPSHPEASQDTTHMRQEGAKWIAGLVANEFRRIEAVKGLLK